jgi:hypothetical protein
MLLAFVPAGAEFRVNTFTTGFQTDPAVAVDGDGEFVVAYAGQDGAVDRNIYARRYNSSGVALGSEFRVNTFTTNLQISPVIAMDTDGDFVVVWESQNQDGSSSGVYAQRYSAAGVAQGTELRVNSQTSGLQGSPSVAMDTVGNFVVAWHSDAQDGSNEGIYAQRFDAAGVRRGSEFQVNTHTTDRQRLPTVAMDGSGDFVVAWQSNGRDGSSYGVAARRYAASGTPRGAEFVVNTFTTGSQGTPSVAMSLVGDFVVAWQSAGQDGSSNGVYAQRYNASGVAQGAEFRANSFLANSQEGASVAMDASGDFLIAWHSGAQDGSGYGIFAQRYNAAGAPQGGEFRINSFTTNGQAAASVAAEPEGDLVVTWLSDLQDGSNFGIYAQRYDETTDTTGPMLAGASVNGKPVAAYSVSAGPISQVVVSFSEDVVDAGGPSGSTSVTNPANWRVNTDGPGGIAQVGISSINYLFSAASNQFQATLNLVNIIPVGNSLQVVATANIRDTAGNTLVDNQDGIVGGDSITFALGSFAAHSDEFRANTHTTSGQQDAAIAMDSDGNFVVVWTSEGQDISDSGVFAQRYNAAGVRLGDEFMVNTTTTDTQFVPAVAMDDSGDFVIAWTSYNQDGYDSGVYAQRYSASGQPQGDEFQVNSMTTDRQRYPSVAMDQSGDFVIAWESYGQDGAMYGIYAQRFNSSGVAQGGEFRVNTTTAGTQRGASVAIDSDGDFVVTWQSHGQDASGYGVYARRFNALGAPLGGEFRVNTLTAGDQRAPAAAMDDVGNFVITWESENQDGSLYGVYAQRYSASGIAQGGEFLVNLTTSDHQRFPTLAMNGAGEFVVAWESIQDGSGYGVYARRYSATGVALSGEFQANVTTSSEQRFPAVAINSTGDFAVAWESVGQDGSASGVYARRFNYGATPAVAALADTPDPVQPGNVFTVTAGGVTDDSAASSVRFYRETNGTVRLQFGAGGDTLVGTDTDGSDGWSLALPTTGLPNGVYTYYAQPVDDEGFVGAPAATTSTVGAPNPLVVENSVLEYQTRQAIVVTFNNALNPFTVAASDLAALNLDTGATPVAASVVLSNNNFVATWVFNTPGVTLSNGDYRFTLNVGAVTDVNASPLSVQHQFSGPNVFFFGGDANRDRKVDVGDLGILASNWLLNRPTFSQGNFDYSADGLVGVADLGILASQWQVVLASPGARSAGSDRDSTSISRVATEVL